MDAKIVFAQYQELCNNSSGFIQYHISKNSILDWFGRTIRGRQKIPQFIRNEINSQYIHDFETAQECDPIETKPSHMQTKKFIIDEEVNSQDTNVSNNNITADALTPPQVGRCTQLIQSIQDRSFISTSEDERDSDVNMRETITPPPIDMAIDEPSKKKYRNSVSDSISYSPLPNVNDYFRKKTKNIRIDNRSRCTGYRNITESSNTINGEVSNNFLSQNNHGYSKLMYLETRGIIRNINKPKHRGVSGNHFIFDVSKTTSWEREAKIKLSYRIRLRDNDIQFCLIIYEHLERMPTTRRNLLLEFKESDPKDETEKLSSKKQLQREIKRKTPLKRNLRFF